MKEKIITCLILALGVMAKAADKPNIIFIMADDLGWADASHNGAEFYETPHFDKLTKDGMAFTRAYTGGPNCAPTRGCLISGMYTPRHKIWTPGMRSKGSYSNMKLLVPNRENENGDWFESKDSLDPKVVSIAEVMKSGGYITAMMGKWHCGEDEQGFDVFTGDGTDKIFKKHYGSTKVAGTLTQGAVKFITENKDRPFFLYLSHWDVHAPHRASKEVVSKYEAKLKTRDDWSEKWNPTYAAMIEAFDSSVGVVRETVETLGLADNTLIIVTSDNGAICEIKGGPLRGGKGCFFEGGVRVATSMCWPGVIKPGSRCDTPITSVDMLPTFADIGGAKLPTTQPVDGQSFVPLLKGIEALENRSIFWHYPMYLLSRGKAVVPIHGTGKMYWRGVPSTMIVKGDWKLIYYYEDKSAKLFNITEDPYEKKELSASQPEKAQTMLKELMEWVAATDAPTPDKINPEFGLSVAGKVKKSKSKKQPK